MPLTLLMSGVLTQSLTLVGFFPDGLYAVPKLSLRYLRNYVATSKKLFSSL